MDLEEAKKILESPVAQKYLEAVDEDAETALDTMKTDLAAMKLYPSSMTGEYKKDGDALDKAWGDFNAAVNEITFGKAQDGKKAMAAYSTYVLSLEVLESDNTRFDAYIAEGVAELIEKLLDMFIAMSKRLREEFKTLQALLKKIEADLKKARKDVKGAEAQRVIDLVITGISLAMPEVSLGVGIGIAVATFVVQEVVDAELGPGSPSAAGALNNAVGDTIGLSKKIPTKFAKLGGAVTGLISLKMDSDEVAQAKKIVTDVQKQLKDVQKRLETIQKILDSGIADLDKLDKAKTAAVTAAKKAAESYKSQAQYRNGLLKELEKIQ